MNTGVLLLAVAMICDLILIGIFFNDYRKTKDKYGLLIVLGFVGVLLVCIYFLLEKLGVVIVF
jgi:hypothetical protein